MQEGRMSRPVERLVDVFSTGDSSGAELCARILNSLAKAAWCIWRVSTVLTRSAITPPEVKRFGSKLGQSEYIVCRWPWQGTFCRYLSNYIEPLTMFVYSA